MHGVCRGKVAFLDDPLLRWTNHGDGREQRQGAKAGGNGKEQRQGATVRSKGREQRQGATAGGNGRKQR